MLQSDCQCFGSLDFSLYGQGALLGTRSPVLMEIITLGCWTFAFIGGRFMSHTSSQTHLEEILKISRSQLLHSWCIFREAANSGSSKGGNLPISSIELLSCTITMWDQNTDKVRKKSLPYAEFKFMHKIRYQHVKKVKTEGSKWWKCVLECRDSTSVSL